MHQFQLGQAESGKSTFQKQFQLRWAAKTLERERPTWQPIVLLNVIQAVRSVLDKLDLELLSHTQPSTSTSNSSHRKQRGVAGVHLFTGGFESSATTGS